MCIRRSFAALSVLAVLAASCSSQPATPAGAGAAAEPRPSPADIAGARWFAHVEALANDDMRGRETGSPEHRKAAEYIAEHFRAAGLEPAGTEGFLQAVSFKSRRIVEEESSLELVSRGKATPV